jgi:hypothetical protein
MHVCSRGFCRISGGTEIVLGQRLAAVALHFKPAVIAVQALADARGWLCWLYRSPSNRIDHAQPVHVCLTDGPLQRGCGHFGVDLYALMQRLVNAALHGPARCHRGLQFH